MKVKICNTEGYKPVEVECEDEDLVGKVAEVAAGLHACHGTFSLVHDEGKAVSRHDQMMTHFGDGYQTRLIEVGVDNR